MDIIVCCKQIRDPEAPSENFEVDSSSNKMITNQNVPYVISPFDENAVEAALRIKDQTGGKVSIISAGNDLKRDIVKKPIAMGADELILLEHPAFSEGDSWNTAYALAMAIKKIGNYDLIFCGRQAADWDSGQVGLGISEFLGITAITLAKKVEVIDGKLRVERVIKNGYQILETAMPALITVSNELGQPRYATLVGISKATRKDPIIWGPEDINIGDKSTGKVAHKTTLLKLFQPIYNGNCEFVTADSPAEAGIALADRLNECRII